MSIKPGDLTPKCRAAIEAAEKLQAQASGKKSPRRKKPKEMVSAQFLFPATWIVPVEVVCGDNMRGRRARIGRSGHERKAVYRVLARHHRELAPFVDSIVIHGGKLQCRLIRLGGRGLDSDGLAGAFKYVRDAVADFLGVDDGPCGPVTWNYAEETGGLVGVRIELRRMVDTK